MKASLLRLISAALIASLLFCACGSVEAEPEKSEGITVYTTEATSITTTESTASETTTTEATTAPITTTTAEEPESEEEPVAVSVSFPEEFFTELQGIFDRYGVNLNCDGDEEECSCDIYNETLDEEGNVVSREKVVSIYYMDLETGYEIGINSGVHYPVASCVKIPFAIYLYEKIADGEIDGDTILTYEERHYMSGTGTIQYEEVGAQHTVMELLELSITISDNIALQMLKDIVDWNDFAEFLSENGCTHSEDTRLYQEKICTESAGAYARILAGFLESDNPYVETFKSHLLQTKVAMIKSSYTIYRKYGWTNYAFHDIAYIDAEHPYVLAILTNLEGNDKADYDLYEEISYLIEMYAVAAWDELLENSD